MSEENGAQHLVLGQAVGLGLHHQHRVLRTGHDHVEAAFLKLLVGRVEEVAVLVGEANTRPADRPLKGQSGDGQGGRGPDHGRDVRVHVLVGGHDGADHLGLVLEPILEQRPDGPVDQARGQGFLLGQGAFALEEATGDLAHGVGLFHVMDSQREKRHRAGFFVRHHGNQHGRVVHGDQNSACGLPRDATGLEGNGGPCEFEGFLDWIHSCSFPDVRCSEPRRPDPKVWPLLY